MKQVTIVGLGNFGYALLKHFEYKETLQKSKRFKLFGYAKEAEIVSSLKSTGTHPYLFPEIKISNTITISNSLEEVIPNSDYVILSVSSDAFAIVLKLIKPFLKKNAVIVNTAKALEKDTGKRLSEVTKQILGETSYSYVLFAGGTIAKDLFKNEPLGASIASENASILPELADFFNSHNLSVYPTSDLVGAEYASALKNVVSILAGIVHGMGFSYGSETFVISRAAHEVESLVVGKLGGKRETYSISSQCWGNDLLMSCTGETRNRELGKLIGKGNSLQEAIEIMEKNGKMVEGVNTIQVLNTLADLKEYPLLEFLYLLYKGRKKNEDIKKIIFNHNF